MILYHGSKTRGIRKFELRNNRKKLDFGVGVYLTTKYEQAKEWAGSGGSVYKFDVDPNFLNWIEYKDEDLNYVLYLCRINLEEIAKEAVDCFDIADVIAGKMLGGKIWRFEQKAKIFNKGDIEYDQFAQGVKLFDDDKDQVCFKTQRAIDLLNKSLLEEITVD